MILAFIHEWSGEAKVDHVDHIRCWSLSWSDKEVLWLNISEDETMFVKLFQSFQYLQSNNQTGFHAENSSPFMFYLASEDTVIEN